VTPVSIPHASVNTGMAPAEQAVSTKLTGPGTFLHKEAHYILKQVERTKATVKSMARGISGHIRAGFSNTSYVDSVVPQVIHDYRERHPHVVLTPVQSVTASLVQALRNSEVDVAFLREPLCEEELSSELIVEEPLGAVIPASDSLASNRDLELAMKQRPPKDIIFRDSMPLFSHRY
jgi:DNA-binding transcriptional LysR family regulator